MRKYLHAAIVFLLCITLTTGCSDSITTGHPDNTPTEQTGQTVMDCPEIPFDNVSSILVMDGRTGKQFTVENSKDIRTIIDHIRPFIQQKGSPFDHGLNGYLFTLTLIDSSGSPIETVSLISEQTVRVGEVLLSVDCGELIGYLDGYK